MSDASVLIIGLGDLGVRLLNMLATQGAIDRLICASRDVERGRQHVAQAALLADMLNGPRHIAFESVDLQDQEATVRLLRTVDCDLIVMAASRHTWWRSPAGENRQRAEQLADIPYGAWLPVQVSLVRTLMEARRESGVAGRVVCLPYPDGVGPALRPLRLAPEIGAGNVTEDAAKLRSLAAEQAGVARADVDVRLVLHHAAERISFPSVAALSGSTVTSEAPPWYAEIRVRGESLSAEQVDKLFRSPFPRPAGVETQTPTAAAAAHLVTALLSDVPIATHAPSPGGLSGGYPVHVSRSDIRLRLPESLSEGEAVRINQHAGLWDGIAGVEPDGTLLFTDAIAEATGRILGLRLDRVPVNDLYAVADEMLQRARG